MDFPQEEGAPVQPILHIAKLKHWKDGSERRYAVDSKETETADASIWISGLYYDPVLNEGRDREDYTYDPLVLENRELEHCLITIRLCDEREYERVCGFLGLTEAYYADFDERFERLKEFLSRESKCSE